MEDKIWIKVLRKKADELEKELEEERCHSCGKKVNLADDGSFQTGSTKAGTIFNWCSQKCYNKWKNRNLIKKGREG